MEPIQIRGKAVDTPTLLRLAREARLLEYDNQIPMELLGRLDKSGTHLLFPQFDGMGKEEDAPPNLVGYTKTTRTELGLLDAVPCQVYMKLKGKSAKEPTTHLLDVSLKGIIPLTDLEDEKANRSRIRDGEHRGDR